ncbi:MAG TPA: toxin TcdB middle/N-terminal domain-containing protein, partial [Nitrolancea sp.]|nr:toxin TcdB middle/N-terminal domain-containing protein [Nitrolancea sp.]
GILAEQAGAWYYKRNLSPISVERADGQEIQQARFAPLETVALKPNVALRDGAEFLDLAGDGQPDLVVMGGDSPGLYEHGDGESWRPFRPFTSRLSRDMHDPNLRFVDLDGDGHADVLISEDDAFVWHSSLAEEGFGPAQRLAKTLDEESGPRIVFADETQSIYLADLSGDGLSDIVRIRNGEVCYWPNLGYGRFGARIAMDSSPWFDDVDQFDHKRIRLADIDGSGTTDIIYLHRDGVHLYFNQSGNSWGRRQALNVFPRIDDVVNIVPIDLLGNGTACLVWSSSEPGDQTRPMRYVNLMGGQKPHLLEKVVNNLGAETSIVYAPSTRFYLQDKYDGRPWITRLPFPVHVVERVVTDDLVSRNRFTTRYSYHHGYFDGVEREFRGFGFVEQWDAETYDELRGANDIDNIDESSYVPPVYTKTWFHTGAYVERQRVSTFFAGPNPTLLGDKYYREPGWSDDDDAAARGLLPDTLIPPDLTTDEEREACRALKGVMLRQEVYALDDHPERQDHPYLVTEQNFAIECLQRRENNRHAVFFTHPREALSYHYERNPADPRIGHNVTLEVDGYGNVLRSVAIGYPRADLPERRPEQNETHLTLTLNRVANRDDDPDWRHVGLPVETSTYEVVKPPSTGKHLEWQELHDLCATLIPTGQFAPPVELSLPHEQWDWRTNWNQAT